MSELITNHHQGDVMVVTLESENIDTTNVADFERQLTELISPSDYQLVLDLSKLGFISSAGLRSLLLAAKAARRHGGDLRLANATATVKRVFLLVGMQDIFRLFNDVPSAVSSYNQS